MHETELHVDEPSAAHVVVRSTEPSGPGDLTRQRRGMLTSLSMLVDATSEHVEERIDAVTEWAPPQFRVEFVVIVPNGTTTDDEDGPTGPLTRRLADLAWSWAAVDVGHAGRAGALDRASSVSTGEFVVVIAGGGALHVGSLSDALGLMWVNGADALVLTSNAPSLHAETDARAERLGTALGLRSGAGGPAVVVLRRWVARFLFDDISRAIDVVEEFADRVRLLELRLLEVVAD